MNCLTDNWHASAGVMAVAGLVAFCWGTGLARDGLASGELTFTGGSDWRRRGTVEEGGALCCCY